VTALVISTGSNVWAIDIVARFDLGLNTQTTPGTGWNNVSGANGTEPVVHTGVVDTSGRTTQMLVRTDWSAATADLGVSGPEANYDGPYPTPALDGIPASVLRDGFIVRDDRYMRVYFENLVPGATYDFLFYGAAANTGERSLFTAVGASTKTAFITPLVNNSSMVATITNNIPDATQQIRIRFEGRRPDGSSQLDAVNDDGVGRWNFLQMTAHLPNLVGDYNLNGAVDSADYTIWRNTLGSTTDLRANGDNTGASAGKIDDADYAIWRTNFGDSYYAAPGTGAGSSSILVPEPTVAELAAVALVMACTWIAFVRRRHARPAHAWRVISRG
jgi:hypothetical protein